MKVVPEDGVRTANAIASTTHIVPDPSLSQLHLLSGGGVTVTIAEDSTNRVFMYPSLDPARFTGASYAARRAIAEAIRRRDCQRGFLRLRSRHPLCSPAGPTTSTRNWATSTGDRPIPRKPPIIEEEGHRWSRSGST